MGANTRPFSRLIRYSILAASLWLTVGVSSAAIIADLNADFTTDTFPTGWRYMRNTGPIGDDSNYTDLLWDAANNRYDITGAGITGPDGSFTTIYAGGNLHPGRGILQGSPFDFYAIAAYTIQPGEQGIISLINGSLAGSDPAGGTGGANGWDIRIYVANTQAGATIFLPWSLAATPFSQALGSVSAGQTIYVAIGPSSNDLFDSALLSFQLNSEPDPSLVPEPGMFSLVGLGLLGVFGQRRYRQHKAAK